MLILLQIYLVLPLVFQNSFKTYGLAYNWGLPPAISINVGAKSVLFDNGIGTGSCSIDCGGILTKNGNPH